MMEEKEVVIPKQTETSAISAKVQKWLSLSDIAEWSQEF